MFYLLPQGYALILSIIEPLEEQGIKNELINTFGESDQNKRIIESVVFNKIMREFISTPLIAIVPTIAITLENGELNLTAFTVFLFLSLFTIFRAIKRNLNSWDLKRKRDVLFFRIDGRSLILIGKIFTILITVGIVYATIN